MTTSLAETASPNTAAASLKVADRCDRCSAQAFVQIQNITTGHDLLFCGHHFAKHETHFSPEAWIVFDERHRINAKPSASSGAEHDDSAYEDESPF